MGEKSKHTDTRTRLEEVSQNQQICSEDRRHLVELINMSMQQLWELAYQTGFEDGMSFLTKETNAKKKETSH
jgi:hypothetical protein